ncbi:hypothetical protein SAMN04515618_10855 [Collimonas sp. OK307]|nr:hypothetical protein SAMN04515618_10855 [Collimonas sp. OK307]
MPHIALEPARPRSARVFHFDPDRCSTLTFHHIDCQTAKRRLLVWPVQAIPRQCERVWPRAGGGLDTGFGGGADSSRCRFAKSPGPNSCRAADEESAAEPGTVARHIAARKNVVAGDTRITLAYRTSDGDLGYRHARKLIAGTLRGRLQYRRRVGIMDAFVNFPGHHEIPRNLGQPARSLS